MVLKREATLDAEMSKEKHSPLFQIAVAGSQMGLAFAKSLEVRRVLIL